MDIPEENESLKIMEYESAKRKTAQWVGTLFLERYNSLNEFIDNAESKLSDN